MLPESLKNAFDLYKRDTNAIATWLANTADKNGHPVHANNKESRGRLKGKARKEAKAAAATKGDATSTDKKQAYLLRLRDFVPLATFIASVKPQIQVPLFMAVTIDRVIEVRRTVTRIMGTNEDNTDEQSDASHLHFVGVLEQVRDILRQQMPSNELDISSLRLGPGVARTNPDASPIGGNDESSASQNPFDILNLYDIADEIRESTDAASPSTILVEYEPEPQDTYHDACLAFLSLLQEVLNQRKKVRELWYNYRAGNVDLGPAAVGVNEAIEICRRMEDDFAPVINKARSTVSFLLIVFKIMCDIDGQELKAPRRRRGPNYQTYDTSSILMWNTCWILQEFLLENGGGNVTIYQGSQGWYDETLPNASSTNKQKYVQDARALREVLSDIRVLDIVSDTSATEDEFTRGIRTLLKNEKLTLWQCFAAQVYLDGLQELQSNPDLAWSEMAGSSDVIKSSLGDALEQPGDVRLVENWREMEDSLKKLKSDASEWDTDPIARYMTEHGFKADTLKFKFLRRHPLYCGVWVHDLRARFHEAGVKFASAFGYIHQTYQLYHALQQERLLGPFAQWMDLITLFEMQERDTFFDGPTPTTVHGYLENLRRKSGLSAIDQTRGNKKGKNKKGPPPNAERGKLRELGPLSMLFKKRFRKSSRWELTPELLKKMVESRGFRFVNRDGKWDLEKPKDGVNSGGGSPDIPATHLIVCTAIAMRWEAYQLALNLFELHMDCFKVLELIRRTINEETVLRLAPESAKQKELPSVVTMVFRDAASDKPQGLLVHAAFVVSRHLRKPNSKVCTIFMRDLGFHPCRCPQNTGRASATTDNCTNMKCTELGRAQ